MLGYAQRFWNLAKGKMTTYVALSIAGISQLAEHSEELLSSWPSLKAFLPAHGKYFDQASHYLISALGLLVVYTRIRRLLNPPGTPK